MLWVLVGNLGYLLSSAVCSLLIWFSFRDFGTQSLSKVWRLLTTAPSCILSPLSGHSRAERQRPLAQPCRKRRTTVQCQALSGPWSVPWAWGMGSVHRLFCTLSDGETSRSALFPFQPTLHFLHHFFYPSPHSHHPMGPSCSEFLDLFPLPLPVCLISRKNNNNNNNHELTICQELF